MLPGQLVQSGVAAKAHYVVRATHLLKPLEQLAVGKPRVHAHQEGIAQLPYDAVAEVPYMSGKLSRFLNFQFPEI